MKIYKYINFAKGNPAREQSFLSKVGTAASTVGGATSGAVSGFKNALKKREELKAKLQSKHPDWTNKQIKEVLDNKVKIKQTVGLSAIRGGIDSIYNSGYKRGAANNKNKEVSYTEGKKIKSNSSLAGAGIGAGVGLTADIINKIRVWRRIMREHPSMTKKEAWKLATDQTGIQGGLTVALGAGIGSLVGSASGENKIKRQNKEFMNKTKK